MYVEILDFITLIINKFQFDIFDPNKNSVPLELFQ